MTTGKEIVVPYDTVNEQVILAAALVSEEERERLVGLLPTDSFQTPEHKGPWTVLGEMVRRKLSYDPATLHKLAQQLGVQVDLDYLAMLQEARPEVPVNLAYHLDALHWDRARANAVTGPIAGLLDALRNPKESPERVRSLAGAVAISFDGYKQRTHLHDPVNLVREQKEEIRQRIAGYAVFPYGLEGLDRDENNRPRIIPGAKRGELTVVTGTPGVGKSTTTLRLVLGLARQRRKVLFGAWEMKSGTNLELLACLALGWNRTHLTTGNLCGTHDDPDEDRTHCDACHQRLDEHAAMMARIGKYVQFMAVPFRRHRGEKRSTMANLDVVQGYIADSGCDVFVADLWKRCLVKPDADEEEEALIRQQAMAEEQQVHCILVQQQRSKDIEMRADKRPTREGIKGSGAWTEVPDTILGIHRPGLWKPIEDNVLEIDVLKQRYGEWPLAVEFDFDRARGAITGGKTVQYDSFNQESSFDQEFKSPQQRKKNRSRGG